MNTKTHTEWLALLRMVKAFRKGAVTEGQLNKEAEQLGFTLDQLDEVIRAVV